MAAVPPPDLLGRLAVHYQLITMDHLNDATKAQAREPERMIGEILVSLGYISDHQLAQLLEAQRQYLEATQEAAAVAAAPEPEPEGFGQAFGNDVQPYEDDVEPLELEDIEPAGPVAPRPAMVHSAPGDEEELPLAATPTWHADPSRIGTQVSWLHKVLSRAVRNQASDVHIHGGAPIKVRIFESLSDLAPAVLSADQAKDVLMAMMTDWQREEFLRAGEVDFSYTVDGVGRFRANVYNQHTGMCGVFHFIPAEPPSLAELGLPNAVAKLVNHQNGIVLITGPSGSGKTSTLAALTNIVNEERADHVLSIEDPIEYVHPSKRCVVNQRQVNRHTRSFSAALKSALREDPDVICVGEMRDLETISLALSAAETGHLVLGTLHTQGAIRTINRIVGAYPPGQQPQVRTMLSESLRAIISQKLIPRADGAGMALAFELLLVNSATSSLIRDNKTFQITSVLQTGRSLGMRSMDESLKLLLKNKLIDKKQAVLNAERPELFE